MTARQFAYQKYLQSPHWLNLRGVVLRRDGYKCTRCPCRRNLQVHHLVYRERFEDSLPEDLTTLCEPCHTRDHGLKSKTAVVIVNGGGFKKKKKPFKKAKALTAKELKIRKRYAGAAWGRI